MASFQNFPENPISFDEFAIGSYRCKVSKSNRLEKKLKIKLTGWGMTCKNDSTYHQFFSILREESSSPNNLNPAIITCSTSNIKVGHRRLKQADRFILSGGDIITVIMADKSEIKFQFIETRHNDSKQYPLTIQDIYHIGERIGEVFNADLRVVHDRSTLEKSVMKTLVKKGNEAAVMRRLNHENVVKLFSTMPGTLKDMHLFIELCDTDLLKMVEFSEQGRLPEGGVKEATRQIGEGLKYMHALGFAHLDIKPDNIFVKFRDDKPTYKIGDFGLSKLDGENVFDVKGTLAYAAPEILNAFENSHSYSGKKADMWALGVLMFCCLSGNFPFTTETSSGATTHEFILSADFNFNGKMWKGISNLAKNAIESLLVIDPDYRMTSNELLRHLWIAK